MSSDLLLESLAVFILNISCLVYVSCLLCNDLYQDLHHDDFIIFVQFRRNKIGGILVSRLFYLFPINLWGLLMGLHFH